MFNIPIRIEGRDYIALVSEFNYQGGRGHIREWEDPDHAPSYIVSFTLHDPSGELTPDEEASRVYDRVVDTIIHILG